MKAEKFVVPLVASNQAGMLGVEEYRNPRLFIYSISNGNCSDSVGVCDYKSDF